MIHIPYGEKQLSWEQPCDGLLTSRVDELKSEKSGRELVEAAMEHPIGTPKLSEGVYKLS